MNKGTKMFLTPVIGRAHPTWILSTCLPFCLLSFVFSYPLLGFLLLFVHSPVFCLHYPLCFCLSSVHVCLPLNIFPFSCLKCHVSTQHPSKFYSKANMKFYNCKVLYNVRNHLIQPFWFGN